MGYSFGSDAAIGSGLESGAAESSDLIGNTIFIRPKNSKKSFRQGGCYQHMLLAHCPASGFGLQEKWVILQALENKNIRWFCLTIIWIREMYLSQLLCLKSNESKAGKTLLTADTWYIIAAIRGGVSFCKGSVWCV